MEPQSDRPRTAARNLTAPAWRPWPRKPPPRPRLAPRSPRARRRTPAPSQPVAKVATSCDNRTENTETPANVGSRPRGAVGAAHVAAEPPAPGGARPPAPGGSPAHAAPPAPGATPEPLSSTGRTTWPHDLAASHVHGAGGTLVRLHLVEARVEPGPAGRPRPALVEAGTLVPLGRAGPAGPAWRAVARAALPPSSKSPPAQRGAHAPAHVEAGPLDDAGAPPSGWTRSPSARTCPRPWSTWRRTVGPTAHRAARPGARRTARTWCDAGTPVQHWPHGDEMKSIRPKRCLALLRPLTPAQRPPPAFRQTPLPPPLSRAPGPGRPAPGPRPTPQHVETR